MKAIGYTRVSTEDQAREGVSLEAQEARIKAWCESKGYPLAGIYSDAGMSGFKMKNRPGLQKALAAVGKGDAFVVYSLSRFSRNVIESLTGLDSLSKRGVDFVSLSESIDTTTAMGKAMAAMAAVFAQLYRDQISEQTKTALSHMRTKMQKTGGDVPFGWRLEASGKKLVKDPEEQKALQRILAQREQGVSLRAIARELTSSGTRTKRGGASWHPQSILQILRSPWHPQDESL